MIDPNCQTCRNSIKSMIGTGASHIAILSSWINDGWDGQDIDALAKKIEACRRALDQMEALANGLRPLDWSI